MELYDTANEPHGRAGQSGRLELVGHHEQPFGVGFRAQWLGRGADGAASKQERLADECPGDTGVR